MISQLIEGNMNVALKTMSDLTAAVQENVKLHHRIRELEARLDELEEKERVSEWEPEENE